MEGTKRRQLILEQLAQSTQPISASRFAKEFGVSRQIIVGDIALLRAAGEEIIATARGYKREKINHAKESKIAVQHNEEQTQEELETIVEHELYGELVGQLQISSQQDVEIFMKNYKKTNASLLSKLTGGIHLHTIRYKNEEMFENIKKALAEKGILYQQ
jgi:transcriptional regulator of NAD metabolism